MTITQLLTLMGHLSLGNDNITPPEKTIFLQYLNLAHYSLYAETAPWNPDLLGVETVTSAEGTNTISLARPPYTVQSVYDQTHRRHLSHLPLSDLLSQDPTLKETGYPRQYWIQKDQIHFYPNQTAPLTVTVGYIPQPVPLNEQTPEADIPYPLAYHAVLVDGALYYLFQEEGGFKSVSKEQAAAERWETGKARLRRYLYHTRGKTISTFQSL